MSLEKKKQITDYNKIFNFVLYHPMPKHKNLTLSSLLDDLYQQNLVPLAIIKNRKNYYFKELKKTVTEDLYNDTDVIVLPLGFNKIFKA
jgi:hypothetical protein